MADGYIGADVDGVGKKIDTSEITVNAQTVERQRIVLADPTAAGSFAAVSAGGALKVDGSAVTQPVSGTVGVSGTVPVSGTFWQATQPISAAALPLPTGAAADATLTGGTQKAQIWDGTNTLGTSAHPVKTDPTGTTTQPVSGTVGISGTVPVSGTFWQATQPVSGTVSLTAGQGVQLIDSGGTNKASISAAGAQKVDGSAVTQPVSGTFWQATQPISGSVSVTGSVAVTGTFWQATQPVSGTVAVSSVAGSVAVTGTFWQATQPVSGTVTANPAVASAIVVPAQTKVSVTNTAVQLPTATFAQGIVVQALIGNAGTVVVGGSGVTTSNGFQLSPGQSITLPINNSNLLYVNGTSGDGVCTIGA